MPGEGNPNHDAHGRFSSGQGGGATAVTGGAVHSPGNMSVSGTPHTQAGSGRNQSRNQAIHNSFHHGGLTVSQLATVHGVSSTRIRQVLRDHVPAAIIPPAPLPTPGITSAPVLTHAPVPAATQVASQSAGITPGSAASRIIGVPGVQEFRSIADRNDSIHASRGQGMTHAEIAITHGVSSSLVNSGTVAEQRQALFNQPNQSAPIVMTHAQYGNSVVTTPAAARARLFQLNDSGQSPYLLSTPVVGRTIPGPVIAPGNPANVPGWNASHVAVAGAVQEQLGDRSTFAVQVRPGSRPETYDVAVSRNGVVNTRENLPIGEAASHINVQVAEHSPQARPSWAPPAPAPRPAPSVPRPGADAPDSIPTVLGAVGASQSIAHVKIANMTPETKAAVRAYFGKDVGKEDIARMAGAAGAPPGAVVKIGVMEYSVGGGTNKFIVEVSHPQDSEYGQSRKFREDADGKKYVYNAYFHAGGFKGTAASGGLDTGLAVFSNQVEALRQGGLDRIAVSAAGEGNHTTGARGVYNGYNTWARFGYEGEVPKEFKDYMGTHHPEVSVPSQMSDLMETAAGRNAWRLHGSDWGGTFDLKPTSLSSKVLNLYIRSKKEGFGESQPKVSAAKEAENNAKFDRLRAELS